MHHYYYKGAIVKIYRAYISGRSQKIVPDGEEPFVGVIQEILPRVKTACNSKRKEILYKVKIFVETDDGNVGDFEFKVLEQDLIPIRERLEFKHGGIGRLYSKFIPR